MRKINFSIAVVIISGSFLLYGCQTGQPKAPKVLAEFTFSLKDGFILLPVTFQGKEYPFVLDTAGMHTVFDDSFKDKLGKRFLWPKRGRGPEGKTFKVEYYSGYEYNLGPLDLEDTTLLRVVDLDLLVPVKKRNFHGIIGLDFLKKYIVQIDFDNNKVTFYKGGNDFDLFALFKPKENKHPEWGKPIPMKAQFLTDLRHIKGTLPNDTQVNFLVDTGWLSPNSLKSSIFDKIYSHNVFYNNPQAKSGYNKINIIEKYSVGPFEYENDVFRRSDKSVLGQMFMSRHIVTFDFPNNVMYLKKGKNYNKQPVIYIALGQTGCVINAASLDVVKVDPNSPAYAKGVREKDILIKVNDTDISALNLVEFMNLSSQLFVNEKEEILLTFKRGDDITTVVFRKSDKDLKKK